MTDRDCASDRAIRAARELQAVAEQTREILRTSRDLVQRSCAQARSSPSCSPGVSPILPGEPGPSDELVDSLLRAFELTEEDGDERTRLLVGAVLLHIGHRVAAQAGPKASGVVVH